VQVLQNQRRLTLFGAKNRPFAPEVDTVSVSVNTSVIERNIAHGPWAAWYDPPRREACSGTAVDRIGNA
jgi:hypothetical protein